MTPLLTWSYWFSLTPPALAATAGRAWSGVIIAAFLAGVLIRAIIVRRAPHAFVQRAWARVARLLTVSGVLLLVLYFFRYEGVPFLGARCWLLLLAAGDAVWVVSIVRHFLVRVPKEREAMAVVQQKQKYLKK